METAQNFALLKMSSIDAWGITRFLATLLVVLLSYFWYKRPKNFPPGPRGFPVVGVLPYVRNKFRPRVFRDWGRTYGPVVGVSMPIRHVVVLNDLEAIQEALAKQKEDFSSRPYHPSVKEIGQGILMVPYGKQWETMRRFGLNTMRGYGMGRKSMEERIQEEIGYLNTAIQQHAGKAFGIRNQLANTVSNIICNMIFGQRFDYDDPMFRDIIETFAYSLTDPRMNKSILMFGYFPFFDKIPIISKPLNEFFRMNRHIFGFVSDVIAEHKKTFDSTSLRDVVDAYVDTMQKGNQEFSEEHLIHYIRELFMAGTETTTSTLRWGILVLLHYPNEQRKLHQEISSVLGNDGMVSMSHRAELQYTQAFIEELYRFRTLAPLAVHHCTSRDTSLRGYSIPKHTVVLANLWAVHNDPNTFPQPDIFKPERHLDSQRRFVKSRHVIPFSVGPRHCLGEQLARMEVFMFLVNLVQKFEFLPDPDARELPNIDRGSGATVYIPEDYKFVAKVR